MCYLLQFRGYVKRNSRKAEKKEGSKYKTNDSGKLAYTSFNLMFMAHETVPMIGLFVCNMIIIIIK